MRHLTRIYFENTATSDKYVAFVDQGVDSHGNPRISYKADFLRTAAEAVEALLYLTRSAAFFKLPVGAHAVVDVYVPDLFGSTEPKTFDYQVYKSQVTPGSEEDQGLGTFFKELDNLVKDKFPAVEGGPAGPAEPVGFTGGSGSTSFSTCTLHDPSGCGGTMEIPCADPLNTVAECNEGSLGCVVPEPPGPGGP